MVKKGIKYEEHFGKEEAHRMKKYLSDKYIGISLIERLGKNKALESIRKRTKFTEEKKKDMLNKLKKAALENKSFYKKDLKKCTGYSFDNYWYAFGSLDKLAKKLNIKFKTQKGITNIERYGKETAEKLRLQHIERTKGKTYEEIHGKEKANNIIRKKEENIKWTKSRIINAYIDIVNNNGRILRSEINKFARKKLICFDQTVYKQFGDLDNLVLEAGIQFRKPKFKGRIGKNETKLLDKIEEEKGIKLERQHPIAGKYLDGYDPINNIVYEVDEPYHKNFKIQDIIRENIIKNRLGCRFVRINDC